MKKVSLLVLVSMILLLAFTSCDMLPEPVAGTLENVKETVVGTFENVKDTVLGFLGIDTHEHVWNEATCESPKTCECGATDGEPLPHSWNEATCQAPKTCSVCGKTEGSALKHTWEQADCENPQTCKVCGETTGKAEGHFWIEATCETAKYCLVCNKVEGEALGHDWAEGDCTTPKTCKTCSVVGAPAPGHNWVAASCTDARTCETCGETDGEALGHDWTEATCLTAKVCNRCELVEGEALDHKWLDATCETPKTCERCQLEEGEAIGHNYEATVVDPTCVNDGYTMHICANCNDTYTDTPVDALGHSWKDANCVDPKTCTVCGDTDGEALGHTWVEATCLTAKTCSVCGETEGEVAGHVGGTATCTSLAKCDVCGEGYGEYDVHTVALSVVEGKPSYACTKCGNEFVPEEYHYFDGTGALPFTNASGDPNAFNGNTENGYYDFICKSETATNNQIQLWIPSNVAQPETLFGFSCENNAFGVFGFKIKPANFQGPIELILAERRNVSSFISWGEGSINALLINQISADNTVLIRGGVGENGSTGKYQDLVTVSLDENDGWIDIALFIDLNSDKTVSFTYFVNGVHVGTFTGNMTITAGHIRAAYMKTTMPNGVKDNGFAIDDIVFGYAANGHYTFDNAPHAITEATCTEAKKCACGIVYGEALGHDFADATCLTAKTCKRCGLVEGDPLGHKIVATYVDSVLSYTCSGCGKVFVADNKLYYDGTDPNNKFTFAHNGGIDVVINENGEYEAIYTGDPANDRGVQHMFWIPNNGANTTLPGFSCENNAFGVISFRIQYNTTEAFTLAIAKTRGASSWDSWDTSSINLINFGAVAEGATESQIKGGLDYSTSLTTVPVVDGWTEWVDVKLFIQLTDAKMITVHYYVNDVYYGAYSRDMANPEGKYTINSFDIQAVYINGWTAVKGTGVRIDDIAFAYSTGVHMLFDGQEHNVTESTDCTTPTSCSCGWIGQPKAHEFSDASCDASATCKNCGATQGERLPHTLVQNEASLVCTVCNRSFAIESEGVYFDGTNDLNGTVIGSYTGINVGGGRGGNASFNGGVNKVISNEDGVLQAISDIDATVNSDAQMQLWIPETKTGFDNLTAANGSMILLAFDLKLNLSYSKDVMSFLLHNSNGWNPSNGIRTDLMNITPVVPEGGVTTGYNVRVWNADGSGQTILPLPVELEEGTAWTEWFNVAIVVALDEATDRAYATYYIDGKELATGAWEITTDGNQLSCVYINLNAWMKDTGYYLDNLAFGHTVNAHWTLDGKDHNVTEATCTEAKKCSCGKILAPALGHDYKPTCTEDSACSRCGEVAKATGHSLVASGYANNAFVYGCANGCGATYNLTGYYMDGTDATRYHENDYVNLDVVNNGADYVLNINDAGQYEMLYPHETTDTNGIKGQQQIWVPLIGNPELMYDFSCANNAVGFLSAKVNVYNNFQGFQMKLNAERGVDGVWDWSKTSFAALDITPVTADTQKTVDVKAHDGKVIKTVEIGEDKWSGWIDVAIKIELHSDNTMTLTYYLDGHEVHTLTKAMPITTGRITSVYINGRTSVQNSGFKFDDLVFGYSVPTYVDGKLNTTEIAAENVQSATLKTLVNSKIKQYDQCTEVNVQGGTPVYVKAFNNNKATEALYFSRTYAWDGTEAEQFSEFRFAVNGEQPGAVVTSITFNYLAKGTVEKNERYEFTDLDGSKFYADAYVQIKTPSTHPGAGDNYPELQGTDLVLDGQWHTMSIDLGEGVEIIDILLNLYHFQGELLISDLVLTYAE